MSASTGRLIRNSEAKPGGHHLEQQRAQRLRKQKQTKQKFKRPEDDERFDSKPNKKFKKPDKDIAIKSENAAGDKLGSAAQRLANR